MIRIEDALRGVTSLGFDTPPIIYFVEANPRYDALVTEIFLRVDAGLIAGVTSTLTLCEVLPQPLRYGDLSLQREYRSLLLHSANFRTLDVSAAVAEQTADLRARYNLRTPDAVQVAVALSVSCEAFLTNDMELKRVREVKILVLDELTL